MIAEIKCGEVIPVFENKYNDSDWYWKPSQGSMFKCNSGQCIDAKYMCDGVLNDCADGSDEFPL